VVVSQSFGVDRLREQRRRAGPVPDRLTRPFSRLAQHAGPQVSSASLSSISFAMVTPSLQTSGAPTHAGVSPKVRTDMTFGCSSPSVSLVSNSKRCRISVQPRWIGWSTLTATPVNPVDHLGADHARADGVDADTVLGVLERGRLGQPDDSVFARDVGGEPREADQTGDGHHVDDRSAPP